MKKNHCHFTTLKLTAAFLFACIFLPRINSHAQTGSPLQLPATSLQTTTPPPFEDMSVFRIQLRLTTGVGSSAGTDESPYVQFNNEDKKFFLCKGIDNFEEGHTDTYDVLTEDVKHVKDIKFIKFGVKGEDGWCLKRVQLFINDNDFPLFAKTYNGPGACMDNKGTFTIPYSDLRNAAGWKYTPLHRDMWKPPVMISKDMIKSLVECSIGNQLNNISGFAWGTTTGIDTRWGECVEYSKVNDSTLHFDLDLQRTLYGPNPEVDVDFDLTFSCRKNKIIMLMKNLKTGTNWVGDAQTIARSQIAGLIGAAIGGETNPGVGVVVGGLLSNYLSFGINLNLAEPEVVSDCLKIKIAANGDIHLR